MTDLRDKLLKDAIRREAEFGRPMTPVEFVDGAVELIKGAVKPLGWHTREDGSMSCRGAYEITHSGGRYFPWTLTCASYPHPMYLSSGDSSKALVKVAEDHNRSRILAALGVK